MTGEESRYERRRRLIGELREELGWEGILVVKVDPHESAIVALESDDASDFTRAILRLLGREVARFFENAVDALGGVVDVVDRRGS